MDVLGVLRCFLPTLTGILRFRRVRKILDVFEGFSWFFKRPRKRRTGSQQKNKGPRRFHSKNAENAENADKKTQKMQRMRLTAFSMTGLR